VKSGCSISAATGSAARLGSPDHRGVKSSSCGAGAERNYGQASSFRQPCLPVVVGDECGGIENNRGRHMQNVERARAEN
jgi:hypothetical protein